MFFTSVMQDPDSIYFALPCFAILCRRKEKYGGVSKDVEENCV